MATERMTLLLAVVAAVLSIRWARYATFRRRTFEEATYLTMLCEWEVEES